LRERLRLQSTRDPLTELFNRRYMEESLDRELRRAIRKEIPLSVMMVDIDHFKKFNDAYGHEAGDWLLQELARIFRTQLRAEDIACRYGGEEFTLILPELARDSAADRAEELLKAIRASEVQYRGKPLPRFSISVGVATCPRNGVTREALLLAADRALYTAKEQGRDRAVAA
jgi:diguanylate cyclase (GGDEF)-like protein